MADAERFDPDRKCRKCGGRAYIEHKRVGFATFVSRIRRTCERCGFIWDELPLDHDADLEYEYLKAAAQCRD